MRDLSTFVDPIIEACRHGGTFAPGETVPETVAEAYAVHTAIMGAFGPPGGFKISQKDGRPPVFAPIPQARCLPTGASVDVPARVGIELEVGFVVTGPLPDPDAPDFRERLIAAVRPAPMIELVGSRLQGPAADDPMAKLADLQANEALVFGDAWDDWQGDDFGTMEITLTCPEREIRRGPATVPGGSALAALDATLRTLGDHCGGLRPGQRLLTGSLSGLVWIRSGQTVSGHIDGLGDVTVRL